MIVTRSSVIRDIVLTILTFGLWNIYVQMRQIWDVNELAREEIAPSFVWVIIYSILTLGIYFGYHEYKLTKKLHLLNGHSEGKLIEIGSALLAILGFWFIVDSYQQNLINKYITTNDLNVSSM